MSLKKLSEKSKEFNLPQENIDKRENGRLSFVSKFPLDKIKDLSIDEYVQGTDENSFCYWLEFKKILFGIGGGNASKFGVYKAKDGNYYTSYGKNKKELTGQELESFFLNIKSGISKALEFTAKDQIDKIKTIDIPLWNMVLQKILSIYYPDKFITIGSPDVLIECARDIKLDGVELKADNSIEINYECKKALSSLPEYNDWSYEEIGTFIWETYLDDSKRDYYILGSKYGENADQDVFPTMLENEAISTGFASNINLEEYYLKSHSEITDFLKEQGEESKSYSALKHFLSLKVGDRIAIKADGSPKGSKGFLSIIGIAEVVERNGEIYRHDPDGLGHLLNVKFIYARVYSEFDLGGYGRTIHKLSKPDHIDLIFKSHYYHDVILEKFEKWLKNVYKQSNGPSLSDRSVKNYVNGIKYIDKDVIKRKVITQNSLFSVPSLTNIKTLNENYFNIPEVKEWNDKGNKMYSNSFQRYIEFIEFENTNQSETSASSNFQRTKDKFENSIFENYIKFLRKMNSELGLMPNDERVVYSVRDNRLNFTVGQRYSFNLYLNDSRGIYGVISKEKLLNSSEPYDGNPPQPFYNYYTDFEPSNKDWSSITEAIKDELNRTTKSGFVRHNNSDFENYVFELSKETVVNNDNMKLSLNTILYGPPGTGKTHILKNQYMDMFTTSESSITRQDFLKDIIQNCSWWQVIALAVLELGKTKVADIFNHEYVQVKAQLSNSTTITPTIWGQLQSHTVENCEHVKVARRMPPMIFNKTEKSEWEILQNEVEEQSPELLELKSKIENFESVPNKRIERFEFLTFHQSYSYEDFIEGIKPELAESDVSYKIEEGVFQKMCNRARNDSSNNYAIFIDEINRGNISSIFGELITLIEADKREGKPNEIKATLPYSKKHFSVPNNLYIIGTMNTADRSVEALDTALRRRFSFIEMNPESEKLNTDEFKCSGIDLAALLNAINARIEKLLDKDYCIGHSYFMTIKNRQEPLEEIKNIFQNKILPLLQEYFYGDWGKILLVVGKEFVETKENTIKFLSTDSYEDFEEYDEKPIYNFTKPSSWTIESFKSIYE